MLPRAPTALRSTALSFPIKVCNGCLVQYQRAPPTLRFLRGGDYQCALAEYGQKATPPCVLGQDEPFRH